MNTDYKFSDTQLYMQAKTDICGCLMLLIALLYC